MNETGIEPAPSKLDAIANMPVPIQVEQIRSFLALKGYLLDFVKDYSIMTSFLTGLLRNKVLSSNRTRKMLIEWAWEIEGI